MQDDSSEMRKAAVEYVTLQDQLKEVQKETKETKQRINQLRAYLLKWMSERDIEVITVRELGVNLQLRTTRRKKKPSKKDDVVQKMAECLNWDAVRTRKLYESVFEEDCHVAESVSLVRRTVRRPAQTSSLQSG